MQAVWRELIPARKKQGPIPAEGSVDFCRCVATKVQGHPELAILCCGLPRQGVDRSFDSSSRCVHSRTTNVLATNTTSKTQRAQREDLVPTDRETDSGGASVRALPFEGRTARNGRALAQPRSVLLEQKTTDEVVRRTPRHVDMP